MRYLRIIIVIVFVFSLVFAGWANNRYYSKMNTDYPEITSSVELVQISVKDPPEAIYQGISASDDTDGDLTAQVMVASISHFLEPGTVRVKYVVFDRHNNSATLTRKVHYTDYEAPVFSLEKAPVYTVGSACDLLDYIRVEDSIDGDISDHIRVISNMVNNFSAGMYPVVLEVSNSCGDTAQVTIWVNYLSKPASAVVRLHQHIVYVQQGEKFTPQQWLAAVTDRNAVALDKANVQIQGNLDVNKPGCYQLVYSYDDGKLTPDAIIKTVVDAGYGASLAEANGAQAKKSSANTPKVNPAEEEHSRSDFNPFCALSRRKTGF